MRCRRRNVQWQNIRPETSRWIPVECILSRLREIVDFDVIKKAGLRLSLIHSGVRPADIPIRCLREAGVEVATVHDYRDVLFGGHAPEPDDHLLEDLREEDARDKAHIGIATDGDADRFGIVDEDGTFVQPNYIIALLFDYLVESRGWKNGVGQIRGHDESDQCAGQAAQDSAA